MRLLMIMLCCAGAGLCQPEVPFGTWRLNTNSSSFGEGEVKSDLLLDITKQDNQVRIWQCSYGQSKIEVRLIEADGHKHATGLPNEVAASVRLDGGLLIIYENADDPGGATYEFWRVSADGARLTRYHRLRDRGDDAGSTLVFMRVR